MYAIQCNTVTSIKIEIHKVDLICILFQISYVPETLLFIFSFYTITVTAN